MGENLRYKIMYYNYSKKRFNRRVKTIRIVGIPGNNLPDKWSINVQVASVRCTQLGVQSRILHS